MATEIGTLYATITANDRQFVGTLQSVERRAAQAGSSIARSLSQLPIGLPAGFALGFAGLATAAVNSAVEIDSMKRALTAVAGSAAEAERQFDRLREVAKLPGIDFTGAIQGAVRLQTVGFSADNAERSLRAFANAIALTGGGGQQLREVTVQLSQMASVGKVLGADLKPILQQAPAVAQALQKMFGTVDSKSISNALKAAGKSSKEFIADLTTELEKIPKVTAGPREALENLGVSFKIALADAGDVILAGLTPALNEISKNLDGVDGYVKQNKKSFEELKAAVGLLGQVSVDAFKSLTDGLANTKSLLGDVTGYINTLNGRLALVVDTVDALRDAWREVKTIIQGIAGIKLPGLPNLSSFAMPGGPLIGSINQQTGAYGASLWRSVLERFGYDRTRQMQNKIAESSKGIEPFEQSGGDIDLSFIGKTKNKPPVDFGGAKGHKTLTELQELQKQLAKLNQDISAFANVTSREYALKIKIDRAQETKRQMEELLKLKLNLFADRDAGPVGQLEALQKYTESLAKMGDVKLAPAGFEQMKQGVLDSASAIETLRDAIDSTLPKIEMTNEQAIKTGKLGEAFQKLNSIEKEIVLTRARNADETIRAADAMAKMRQYAGELKDLIGARHERVVADLQKAAEKRIFDAQGRLDDFKSRMGQGFDDLISSLAEGGDRWINAAKNIGVNFFNTLASEMMLAATGGKHGSIGGLLGGLAGGVLSGLFGGGVKLPIGKGIPIPALGTGHAGGGMMTAGEWGIVGEEGPELVNFGNAARVYSNEQSRGMMSGRSVTVVNNFHITAPGGQVAPKTQQQIAAQAGASIDHALRRNG